MAAVSNSIQPPTTDPEELARRDVSRFRTADSLRTSKDSAPIFQDPTVSGSDPLMGYDAESSRADTVAAYRKQAQEKAQQSIAASRVMQLPLQEVTAGQTANQLESRQVSITRPEQKAPAPPTPDQEAAEVQRLEARAVRIEADLPQEERIKWYLEKGIIRDPNAGKGLEGDAKRAAIQQSAIDLRAKGAGQAARLAAFGALTTEDRFEASKPGSQAGSDLDSVSRVAEALENPNAEVSDVDLVRFADATESKTAVINDSRIKTEALREQVTTRRTQGIREGRAALADATANVDLETMTPADYDAAIKDAVKGLPSIERSAALADARANLPEPIQAQLKADMAGEAKNKAQNDMNFSQNFEAVRVRFNQDSPAAQIKTYEELVKNPEALAAYNAYLKDEATLVNGEVVDRTKTRAAGANVKGTSFTATELSDMKAKAPVYAAVVKEAEAHGGYTSGDAKLVVNRGQTPLDVGLSSRAMALMANGASLEEALRGAATQLKESVPSLSENAIEDILAAKGDAAIALMVKEAKDSATQLGQANRGLADEWLGEKLDTEGERSRLFTDLGKDVFESSVGGNPMDIRGAVESRLYESMHEAGLSAGSKKEMEAVIQQGIGIVTAGVEQKQKEATELAQEEADEKADTLKAVHVTLKTSSYIAVEKEKIYTNVLTHGVATTDATVAKEVSTFNEAAELNQFNDATVAEHRKIIKASTDLFGVLIPEKYAANMSNRNNRVKNFTPTDTTGHSDAGSTIVKKMHSETVATTVYNGQKVDVARSLVLRGRAEEGRLLATSNPDGSENKETSIKIGIAIGFATSIVELKVGGKETLRKPTMLEVEKALRSKVPATIEGKKENVWHLTFVADAIGEAIAKGDTELISLFNNGNEKDRALAIDMAVQYKLERSDADATRGALESNGILGDSIVFTITEGPFGGRYGNFSPSGAKIVATGLVGTLEVIASQSTGSDPILARKLSTANGKWETKSEQLRKDRNKLGIGTEDIDRIDAAFAAVRNQVDSRRRIRDQSEIPASLRDPATVLWETEPTEVRFVGLNGQPFSHRDDAEALAMSNLLDPVVSEASLRADRDGASDALKLAVDNLRATPTTGFGVRLTPEEQLDKFREVILADASPEQRSTFDEIVLRQMDTAVEPVRNKFLSRSATKQSKSDAEQARTKARARAAFDNLMEG